MSKLLITLAAAAFALASTPTEAQPIKQAAEKGAKAEAEEKGKSAQAEKAAKAEAEKKGKSGKKGKSRARETVKGVVAKTKSDAEKGSVTTK